MVIFRCRPNLQILTRQLHNISIHLCIPLHVIINKLQDYMSNGVMRSNRVGESQLARTEFGHDSVNVTILFYKCDFIGFIISVQNFVILFDFFVFVKKKIDFSIVIDVTNLKTNQISFIFLY